MIPAWQWPTVDDIVLNDALINNPGQSEAETPPDPTVNRAHRIVKEIAKCQGRFPNTWVPP